MSEVTILGAAELARLIQSGQLSSREAVDAHIQQIEKVNPRLNAVVVPLFDQARDEAARADAARARGAELGPLHGVPITIKECHHVTGTASTAGLESQTGHRAECDALMVGRLRRAGAVVLGKTNVPQLMLYYETDNPVYGRTNNPWNPDRSPGGSSGGEGAIIAAGGSPLGLGSDIGGSIRNPAHACGIQGIKPTSGRLSVRGSADQMLFPGMEAIADQMGPLARRVEDLALAMSVLAAPGQELEDPAVPPVPWRDPAAVSVKGLRVGMYIDDGFLSVSPAIRRAVKEAGNALAERGARVVEFRPPAVSEAVRLYTALLSADGAAWTKPLLRGGRRDRRINGLIMLARLAGGVRRSVAWSMERAGQKYLADSLRAVGFQTAEGYWRLIAERKSYQERFLAALGDCDAIICPPFMTPALRHGASEWINSVGSYASLYNVLGLPAGVEAATRVRPGEESDRAPSKDVVLRTLREVEQGSTGLPVGVQVAARHWREDIVLAVMGALEEHFRMQPDYPVWKG